MKEDNKYILARCSICDHLNHGGDTRDFQKDPSTGELVCIECWDTVFQAIVEFGVDDPELTVHEDSPEVATHVATTPQDASHALILELLEGIGHEETGT